MSVSKEHFVLVCTHVNVASLEYRWQNFPNREQKYLELITTDYVGCCGFVQFCFQMNMEITRHAFDSFS